VVVIVLGDLGRSPRMQYHAQSFLEAGHSVTFVGYEGEELIPTLTHKRHRDRLTVVRFDAPVLPSLKQFSLALYFLWRIVSLSVLLVHNLLFRVPKPSTVNLVLIQNPPALPLLAVAVLYSHYVRAPLVVDWHNLGYSMLPDRSSTLRKLGEWYERLWSPCAHGHLTVTRALEKFLREEFAIVSNVGVLYDCPPAQFRCRTVREQHELLKKVDRALCEACPAAWGAFQDPDRQTLFTEQLDGPNRFAWRPHRPALITSATSWTKDEDMGLLLEALALLDARIGQDQRATGTKNPLKVVCVITGKGPLKNRYQPQLDAMGLQHVAVTTLWLSPEDYPKWLACADLGVSLHTSTSGRDLPIKILDYFGCEIPVVAYNFGCLYELVQHDVNGRVFTTSRELSDSLWELLSPLSVTTGGDSNSSSTAADSPALSLSNHDFGDLKRYSLQVQGKLLWSTNWTQHAWPVMEAAVRDYYSRRNRSLGGHGATEKKE
jgi:beta-1,4-mannosyltransferase